MRDVRFALRTLASTPAYTLTAVLSLALGIGANTAIFSVVQAELLRPLPYRDAGRLVILWNTSPGLNITQDWFSTAQYFDIKTRHAGFSDVGIAIGATRVLRGVTFGVSASDPVAFGGVALLLTTTGLAASLFPARRATRIDPIASLK